MLYAVEAMRTPVVCFLLTLSSQMLPAATGYLVHNLVADDKSVATADFYDPRLINPWGNVTSATSPFWVCDLGLSTIYTVNATNATALGTLSTSSFLLSAHSHELLYFTRSGSVWNLQSNTTMFSDGSAMT